MGLLTMIIGAVAGAMLWMTSINASAKSNKEILKRVEKKQSKLDDRIFTELNSIKDRLSKIEGYLQKSK